jgi:flagellar biogenesis protein FliO
MLMVNLFSSNTHDKSLEAAMTSFFVYGPLAAVLSFIVTLVYLLSRRGR